MGSVGTALPGGAGIRYYNPVLPFFSNDPYVTVEFGQLPGDVSKGGIESAMIFGEFFTAVGFYSSSVEFETRDERGFGSTASSATTIGMLSAGYIRDNMSIGIGLTMIEDRIWVSSSYTAFALSGGLGYKMFDGKLSLGAAGFHGLAWSRGFGDSVSTWYGGWRDGRVPRFARGGAAWADTLGSFPYTVAADLAYRDEDRSFTVPMGVEVSVLPMIDVRIGKRIGWETEILSLGVGFSFDKLAFDAAFVPSVLVDDYEIKWSMAFTYRLGGKQRKDKAIKMKPLVIEPQEEDEETVDKLDSQVAKPEEVVDKHDSQVIEPEESIDKVDNQIIESEESVDKGDNQDIKPESSSPEIEGDAEDDNTVGEDDASTEAESRQDGGADGVD
jgi:hypothetical protein